MSEHHIRSCEGLQHMIICFVIISSVATINLTAGRVICRGPWVTSHACHGGSFVEHRGLLRSLTSENELEPDRTTVVAVSVDVPQSKREETIPESRDGRDENNIAENDDDVAHDVENLSNLSDAEDDVTIRKLQRLPKELSSQIGSFRRRHRQRQRLQRTTTAS